MNRNTIDILEKNNEATKWLTPDQIKKYLGQNTKCRIEPIHKPNKKEYELTNFYVKFSASRDARLFSDKLFEDGINDTNNRGRTSKKTVVELKIGVHSVSLSPNDVHNLKALNEGTDQIKQYIAPETDCNIVPGYNRKNEITKFNVKFTTKQKAQSFCDNLFQDGIQDTNHRGAKLKKSIMKSNKNYSVELFLDDVHNLKTLNESTVQIKKYFGLVTDCKIVAVCNRENKITKFNVIFATLQNAKSFSDNLFQDGINDSNSRGTKQGKPVVTLERKDFSVPLHLKDINKIKTLNENVDQIKQYIGLETDCKIVRIYSQKSDIKSFNVIFTKNGEALSFRGKLSHDGINDISNDGTTQIKFIRQLKDDQFTISLDFNEVEELKTLNESKIKNLAPRGEVFSCFKLHL